MHVQEYQRKNGLRAPEGLLASGLAKIHSANFSQLAQLLAVFLILKLIDHMSPTSFLTKAAISSFKFIPYTVLA